MPVHRVPTGAPDLEHAVAEIEASEQIVGVTAAGDGAVLVFTRGTQQRRPGGKETRG